MGELYHHGVKGMKWGVRKKPQYETVFTIPARKKKTSSKTSVKKSKNDNLTDEQLAAKKAKRKKALTIAGYAAATVAISVAGAYAVSSPKVRGLVGKGMEKFSHEDLYESNSNPHDGMFRNKKTGTWHDISELYDISVNTDGSAKTTRKPGVNFDDYVREGW